MSGFVYYNGNFDKKENIRIPLNDRSLFFGDGVYDMAIGRGGKIYQSDLHIARLLTNIRRLGIKSDLTEQSLFELLEQTVRRAGYDEYTVYFHVTRTKDTRVHSSRDTESALMISVNPYKITPPEGTVKLLSYIDKRYFYCNIKTLNLLPSVIASTAAENAGCDEALFHRDGIVTECAHSNFFMLKDGKLIGHPDGELILPGITGINLVNAANKLGIEVERRAFKLSEVFDCDEALITSTTKFARRVAMLDGVSIGGKDEAKISALIEYLYLVFCKNMEN